MQKFISLLIGSLACSQWRKPTTGPDGKADIRICAIKREHFRVPTIEELATRLNGAQAIQARLVKLNIVYARIFDIIENTVIKCVFLNKAYLSNSQFVFSQCISHLLLRNAPSVYLS